MKETRYLWISNLPRKSCENDLKTIFESFGRVLKINIFEVGKYKGAVVVFLDSKAASQAFSTKNTLDNCILDVEYCESNGEPGLQKLKEQNFIKNENNTSSNIVENGLTPLFSPSKSEEHRTRHCSPNHNSHMRSRSSSLSGSPSSQDVGNKRRSVNIVGKSSYKFEKSDKGRCPSHQDDNSSQGSNHSEKSRTNGLCRGVKITNLPLRSSDSSIRDGLFHEYKKYGKVMSVCVEGSEEKRHAIVSFKSSDHADKAYDQSKTKVFFGKQISVERHDGADVEDADICLPDKVMDEYHYRATKTLFVGNLDSDIKTASQLHEMFQEYGQILDVDIKQSSSCSYAFVQFVDIESVVRALEDIENIRQRCQKVKLGFGKSQANNCIWLANVTESVTESFLRRHFARFGKITQILIDRKKWRSLIYFDNIEAAQNSVSEIKNRGLANKKVQIDYASRECQQHFVNDLYKTDQWHKDISNSYDKAAYRTFAHYMSSRDMYKYLTTLNMITHSGRRRSGRERDGYPDGYEDVSRRHFDDQEFAVYNSRMYSRSDSGNRRSGKSDANDGGRFSYSTGGALSAGLHYSEERKDRYPSSLTTPMPITSGKHRSTSPYSVYSTTAEVRSKSKSPSRSVTIRRERNKPSSDDGSTKRRAKLTSTLASEINATRLSLINRTKNGDLIPDGVLTKIDTSQHHLSSSPMDLAAIHRPNRKDHAEIRLRRNLKKINGRDLKDSSSSSSDYNNKSPSPQKTDLEVNQLKKLEREKALLLHQLSQLEDDDSDTSRTDSVDGQRLSEIEALNRGKLSFQEVFSYLDDQLDADDASKNTWRRISSEDIKKREADADHRAVDPDSTTLPNVQKRLSVDEEESRRRFEEQLQILRRSSSKQQNDQQTISLNTEVELLCATPTSTSTLTSTSFTSTVPTISTADLPSVSTPSACDETSSVQLPHSRSPSQPYASSNTALSSSDVNNCEPVSPMISSTSTLTSPALLTASRRVSPTSNTNPVMLCSNLPRDPRLLPAPVPPPSVSQLTTSNSTTDLVNQLLKKMVRRNAPLSSSVSATTLSSKLPSSSSSFSASSVPIVAHPKPLRSTTVSKTPPLATAAAVKRMEEEKSPELSDPENETVMKQHRSLEDRIKALDAKLTKASEPTRPLVDYSKYKIKKRSEFTGSTSVPTIPATVVTTSSDALHLRIGATNTTEFVKSMMKNTMSASDCRHSSLFLGSECSSSSFMQPLTIGIGGGTSSSVSSPMSRGYLSQSSLGSAPSSADLTVPSSPLVNGRTTVGSHALPVANSSTIHSSKHSTNAASPPMYSVASPDTSLRPILKKDTPSPLLVSCKSDNVPVSPQISANAVGNAHASVWPLLTSSSPRGHKATSPLLVSHEQRIDVRDPRTYTSSTPLIGSKVDCGEDFKVKSNLAPSLTSAISTHKRKASVVEVSDDVKKSKVNRSLSVLEEKGAPSLFKPDSFFFAKDKEKGSLKDLKVGAAEHKKKPSDSAKYSSHNSLSALDPLNLNEECNASATKPVKTERFDKVKKVGCESERDAKKVGKRNVFTCDVEMKREKEYKRESSGGGGGSLDTNYETKKARKKENKKLDEEICSKEKKLGSDKRLVHKMEDEKRSFKKSSKRFKNIEKSVVDNAIHQESRIVDQKRKSLMKSKKSDVSKEKKLVHEKDKKLKIKKDAAAAALAAATAAATAKKNIATGEKEWKPTGRSSDSASMISQLGFNIADYMPYESMYDKIKRRGGRAVQCTKDAHDEDEKSKSSKALGEQPAWLSDVSDEEDSSEEETPCKKKGGFHLKATDNNAAAFRKRSKHSVESADDRSSNSSSMDTLKKIKMDNDLNHADDEDEDKSAGMGGTAGVSGGKNKKVSKRKVEAALQNRKRKTMTVPTKKVKVRKLKDKNEVHKNVSKSKMTVDSVFGTCSEDESSAESPSIYPPKTPSTEPMTDESQTESSADDFKQSLLKDNKITFRRESMLQDLFSDAKSRIDPRSVTEKKSSSFVDDESFVFTEDLPCIEKMPYDNDHIEKSPGSIDEEPPSLIDADMDDLAAVVVVSSEVVVEDKAVEQEEDAVKEEKESVEEEIKKESENVASEMNPVVSQSMDTNDLDSAVALIELAQAPRISVANLTQTVEALDNTSSSGLVSVTSEEFRSHAEQFSAAIILGHSPSNCMIAQPAVVAPLSIMPLDSTSSSSSTSSFNIGKSDLIPDESAHVSSNLRHLAVFNLTNSNYNTSSTSINTVVVATSSNTATTSVSTSTKMSMTPIDQLKKEDMEKYVKSVMKKVEEETKQNNGAPGDKAAKRIKKPPIVQPIPSGGGLQSLDKNSAALELRPLIAPVISDITSLFSFPSSQSSTVVANLGPAATAMLPLTAALSITLPLPTTLPVPIQVPNAALAKTPVVPVVPATCVSQLSPCFSIGSSDKEYSLEERAKRRISLQQRRKRDVDPVRGSAEKENSHRLASLDDTINSVLTQNSAAGRRMSGNINTSRGETDLFFLSNTTDIKSFELDETEDALRDLDKSTPRGLNDSEIQLGHDPYEPNFDETPAFDLKALQHKPPQVRLLDAPKPTHITALSVMNVDDANSAANEMTATTTLSMVKPIALDIAANLLSSSNVTTATTSIATLSVINNAVPLFVESSLKSSDFTTCEPVSAATTADSIFCALTSNSSPSVPLNLSAPAAMATSVNINMAAPLAVPNERRTRITRPMDAETIRHVEEVIEMVARGEVNIDEHVMRIEAGEIARRRSNSGEDHIVRFQTTSPLLTSNPVVSGVASNVLTNTSPHILSHGILLAAPTPAAHNDKLEAQKEITDTLHQSFSASQTSIAKIDSSISAVLEAGSHQALKDDVQQSALLRGIIAGQLYTVAQGVEERAHAIERLPNSGLPAGFASAPAGAATTQQIISTASSSPAVSNVNDMVVSAAAGGTPRSYAPFEASQAPQQQENSLFLYNAMYAAMIRASQAPDPYSAAALYPHMAAVAATHDPSHLYASYLLNVANRDAVVAAAGSAASSVPSSSQTILVPGNGQQPVALTVPSSNNLSAVAVVTQQQQQQQHSSGDNVKRDHMHNLMQKYPIVWQGKMALKNEEAGVQMHFVCGSSHLVKISMDIAAPLSLGEAQPLKIVQRMRLEQQQLEGVCRKMQDDNDYCMLLAVACGHDDMDYQRQTISLTNGFIKYLQDKMAAGIVNVNMHDQPAYVVHIFPPSDFSRDKLGLFARDLLQALYMRRDAETPHLLVVITTV